MSQTMEHISDEEGQKVRLCWVFWHLENCNILENKLDVRSLVDFKVTMKNISESQPELFHQYLADDTTLLVVECTNLDSELMGFLKTYADEVTFPRLILINRFGCSATEYETLMKYRLCGLFERTIDRRALATVVANGLVHIHDMKQMRERAGELRRYISRLEKLSSETSLLRDLGRAALNDAAIVAFTDQQGRITRVNDNYIEISGYGADEVIGLQDAIPLASGAIDGSAEDIWRQLMINETWKGELKRTRKDQSSYWVYCVISPVLDEFDEVDGYVTIAFDISDKKKAEESSLQAKILAEKSAEARKIFLANMSHEIRTPLNAILGMSQLLNDTHMDAEQKDMLQHIRGSGQHMLELISHILDFSKIDAGRVEVNAKAFAIADAVQGVCQLMESLARAKDLAFHCHIDALPGRVEGDEKLLKQILVNLLGNAMKFTHKGFVALHVSVLPAAESMVKLQFKVSDSGIGIDPERLRELFEPFVQANSNIGIEYGGSGLGLALSKRLAELMGGSIEAHSEPQKGSEFIVNLPFKLLPEAAASQTLTPALDPRLELKDFMGQKNILVVDDIDVNRMVMRGVLRKIGARSIGFAVDGVDAINQCKSQEFDLIFMDMRMPNMDGLQATREIRNLSEQDVPHLKKAVILALTANASHEDLVECQSAGMDGFLPKPLAEKDLLHILQAIAQEEQDPAHERFYSTIEQAGSQ